MNKRIMDPSLEALPPEELRRRLAFEDWKDEARHIKDEVVFGLFRQARRSEDKSRIVVLSEVLTRRILARARGFVIKSRISPGMINDLDEATFELAQFIWDKLTISDSDAAHAERAFGQLFERRGIDFQRKLLAKKRTQQSSLDALDQTDDGEDSEGAERVVASLQDTTGPDDVLAQKQEFNRLRSIMHAVLTSEELSTLEMIFDLDMPVKDVAKALGRNPKSIFNYKTKAFEKLQKELTK